MLLVMVSEMINMLIIELYCNVIPDFFRTSRKDKAVAKSCACFSAELVGSCKPCTVRSRR